MVWKVFIWVIFDVKPLHRFGLLPTWPVLLQIKLHITIIIIMKWDIKVKFYYSDLWMPCGKIMQKYFVNKGTSYYYYYYHYYYYLTWIIYILYASEWISTRLLFHLGLMSQVAENATRVKFYSSDVWMTCGEIMQTYFGNTGTTYYYYYYFTWIIYILYASGRIYTRLLFHLGLISQVAENTIPPFFVS